MIHKRARRSILHFLPRPRRSWWYAVYALFLGVFTAALMAALGGGLGWLPVLVAVGIWCGCFAIWFVAERLI